MDLSRIMDVTDLTSEKAKEEVQAPEITGSIESKPIEQDQGSVDIPIVSGIKFAGTSTNPEDFAIKEHGKKLDQEDTLVDQLFRVPVAGPFARGLGGAVSTQLGAPVPAIQSMYYKYKQQQAQSELDKDHPFGEQDAQKELDISTRAHEVAQGTVDAIQKMYARNPKEDTDTEGWLEHLAAGAGAGVGSALISYVGARTMPTPVSLGIQGAMAGALDANDAYEKTGDIKRALTAGTVSALFETLTEFLPDKMVREGLKGNYFKRFINLGTPEAFGEGISQLGQDLNRMTYDKEFTKKVVEDPVILLKNVGDAVWGSIWGSGVNTALENSRIQTGEVQDEGKKRASELSRQMTGVDVSGDFNTVRKVGDLYMSEEEYQRTKPLDEGKSPIVVQLKEGVTPTADHMAYQLKQNGGMSDQASVVAAEILTRLERNGRREVGGLIKDGGLSLGAVGEMPVGHVYEFGTAGDPEGPVSTITKNEDGTWTAETFEKRGGKSVSMEIIQPKDVQATAASFRKAGMKPESFNYTIGEQGVQEIFDSLSKNPNRTLDETGTMMAARKLLDDKTQAVKTVTEDPSKAEATKLATGWFKDKDDAWKYEFLDDRFVFKPDADKLFERGINAKQTFGVSFATLFGKDTKILQLYPELNDYMIKFQPAPKSELSGLFDERNQTIVINPNAVESFEEAQDTLRHEIQHYIQTKEGFAEGITPEYASKMNPRRFHQLSIMIETILKQDPNESNEDYDKRVADLAANKLYMETHGEMEARQSEREVRGQIQDPSLTPVEREAKRTGVNIKSTGVYKFARPSASKMVEEYYAGKKLASITMMHTGEKLIQIFDKGNFAALIHEFGHLILTQLNNNQIGVVANWAASKKISASEIERIILKRADGFNLTKEEKDIYTDVHEKFAKTFEEYMRKGKAPSISLKRVFEYAKQAITDIYYKYARVPGSKLSPEIKQMFDHILVDDVERFNGTVVVKHFTQMSENGEVKVPGITYQVVNHNGKASVEVPAFLGTSGGDLKLTGATKFIDIENMIRGEKLTPEQISIFGEQATWETPYAKNERLEKLDREGFDRNVVIPLEELKLLKPTQLNRIASRLGMGRQIRMYTREQLEELIHGKMQAEARVNKPEARDSDIQDAVEYIAGEQEAFKSEELEATGTPVTQPRYVKYVNGDVNIISSLIQWHSAWIIDRIRDIQSPIAAYHYRRAQVACDLAHKYVGEQNKLVKEIQKLVRWGGKFQPGYNELMGGEETRFGFINQLVAQLDNDYAQYRKPISAEAQAIVDKVKELLDLQVNIAQRERMTIRREVSAVDPTTGKVVKSIRFELFSPSGKMPRAYTEDFWRILTSKDDSARIQLTRALAELNPSLTFHQVKLKVAAMHTQASNNKKLFMEVERQIPIMPTHLKLDGGGMVELLHTDPFDYAPTMQHKVALRASFFNQYATPTKENPALRAVDQKHLNKFVDDFNQQTGKGYELNRLFAALNGVPLYNNITMGVDTPGYTLYRNFSNWLMIQKSLWLTNSWVVNFIEPMIRTPASVGWTNYLHTVKDFTLTGAEHAALKTVYYASFGLSSSVKNMLAQDTWSLMKEQMEFAGTISPRLAKFSMDKKDALRSVARNISSTINKISGTSGAISFGSYFSAWAGHIMAEKLRAGNGSRWDANRLRIMGFTESQVNQLIAGSAPQELYDRIPARITTTQMGTDVLPAEKSIWHNWKHAGEVIGFDRYIATAFRYNDQVLRSMYQTQTGSPVSIYSGFRKYLNHMQVIIRGFIPGKNFSPEMVSTQAMAVVAGALTMEVLRPLVRLGPDAFKFGVEPPEDDETKYRTRMQLVLDSYIASQLSGPLSGIYNDWRQDRLSVESAMSKPFLPVALGTDLLRMFSGSGMYADKYPLRKAELFMRTNLPVSTTLTSWLSFFGILNKDTELQSALVKINKWKQQHGEGSQFGGGSKNDSDYRKAIDQAYQYMIKLEKVRDSKGNYQGIKREDFDKVAYELDKAFNLRKFGNQEQDVNARKDRVASSLLGKQIYANLLPDNKKLFVKNMDKEMLRIVAEHDILLQALAKKIRDTK